MALPILDGNQSATTLSTILAGGEHTPAHTVVSLGSTAISNITSAVSGSVVSISNFPATQPISGSISISGTPSVTFSAVSISNFPASQTIAGTVTANVLGYSDNETSYQPIPVVPWDEGVAGGRAVVVKVQQEGVGPLPISGTVTANLANVVTTDIFWNVPAIKITGGNGYGIDIAGLDNNSNRAIFQEGGGIPVYPRDSAGLNAPFPISGTVSGTVTVGSPLNTDGNALAVALHQATYDGNTFLSEAGAGNATYGIKPIYHADVTDSGTASEVKESAGLPIRGSIGEFTTRFGTPTTANVSFATTAVTNANRKYLLIQNVTTGSNVITVGIGFTPTTTQGIQLTAGAGITFESSYIPTGAVYVLSSVTASNFTILEA